MANLNGNPRWMTGQSGNPLGRKKLPQFIKTAQTYSKLELILAVSSLLKMTKSEVIQVTQNKETEAIEQILASILLSAISGRCTMSLNFILKLVYGRPPKKIQRNLRST